MIPDFEVSGNLPPGRHRTNWAEFARRYGTNDHRKRLLAGMKQMLLSLKLVGCQRAYIDGSFVTSKDLPGDYDGCWSGAGVDIAKLQREDPVLLDFSNQRRAQKLKYGGEMFPSELTETASGRVFLEFFEHDKNTGDPKGIVEIELGGLT